MVILGVPGVDVAELRERWSVGGLGYSRLWSWVLVLMLRRTKSVVGDRERGLSAWSWIFSMQLSLSMSSLWGMVLFGEPLGLKNPELGSKLKWTSLSELRSDPSFSLSVWYSKVSRCCELACSITGMPLVTWLQISLVACRVCT